jgi:hypothetical protein
MHSIHIGQIVDKKLGWEQVSPLTSFYDLSRLTTRGDDVIATIQKIKALECHPISAISVPSAA